MGLWMFLWHKSKLNMPKCILMYLLVYGGIPALIFWDMLGPFNVPPEKKHLFSDHLLINYVICTVICVNSFQFSALMAVTFVALSFASFEGQCQNPYAGVKELIVELGCDTYVQSEL